MAYLDETTDSLVRAYLTLRKFIGILGLLLPLVLWLGAVILFGTGVQGSVSGYYHTGMGDVFVGTLCAIGVFLLTYKGHERRDDWAGNVACVFAVGVAVLPPVPPIQPSSLDKALGAAHLTSAALLFLILAYFSLCLFTKTDKEKTPTARKLRRNQIYRVCGFTILAAILLIGVHAILPALKERLETLNPVFWLESLAIVSFGVSWLVKGEAILGDETCGPSISAAS